MPRFLADWLGLLFVLVLALIPALVGAAITFSFGFAWGVLICVGLAALAGRFIPTGHYGEGAFVIVWIWILLAIGIFAGLVTRLVLT